jgi:hypothetical protein
MQYQEYRLLRDRIVAKSSPLRMDCMNPTKALAHLAPRATGGSATVDEALAAWRKRFAPGVNSGRTVATTGVRSALRGVFAYLSAAEYELWLPEDVYPEYWKHAVESGLLGRAVVTLPQLDLTFLPRTAARGALLLPHPLAPLGRRLADDETDRILDWLSRSPERRVILDAVYLFDNRLDEAAQRLLLSEQAFIVHSIAKAWLLPDTFGVVLSPDASPAHAVFAFESCPDLPLELAATFRRQWAACAERIRAASTDWQPPETGYFSVIQMPFDALLEQHGILGAPASVFGSRRDDVSVISCLYYPA